MTYESYKRDGITILNFTVHQYDDWGAVVVAVCSGGQSFKVDAPHAMYKEITEKASRLRQSIFCTDRTITANNMGKLAAHLQSAIKKAGIQSDAEYLYGRYYKEISSIMQP